MNGGRHIAILIGNSEFSEEPSLSALRCPQRDVEGLAAVLTAQETGLFADPLIFINEPHHKVLPAINRVFKQAGRRDQILIYYSGHGKQDNAGGLHLATADTEVDALETTSIAVDSFRKLIDNHACKQVALILDCCFGGAAGKDFLKGGVDDQLQQVGRGIYVLTASTATQTAREKDGDEYSLLTKHILHGIAHGEADQNGDGLVSLDDLYEYVRVRVPREAPQHPMKYALGIQGGEFVIARAVKIYSPEQLRAFREQIKRLDNYLPDDVYDQAIQVIRAGQPKQDKQFLSLLEALSENRANVGEFISRWLALGLPLSVQQQRDLVAQRQRELGEQRKAEAARQAEEQRRREEQQRLQEQARQFELETQRQREEEKRRQGELEAQRQRDLEEQRRTEAVRKTEEQRQRELEEQQRRAEAEQQRREKDKAQRQNESNLVAPPRPTPPVPTKIIAMGLLIFLLIALYVTYHFGDSQTRQELATLKGHASQVGTVAFSPDGKTLASGSSDKSVKLWDAQTRQELATLNGHAEWVYSVAFSPDGKTLASGSYDSTVKLWDAQTR